MFEASALELLQQSTDSAKNMKEKQESNNQRDGITIEQQKLSAKKALHGKQMDLDKEMLKLEEEHASFVEEEKAKLLKLQEKHNKEKNDLAYQQQLKEKSLRLTLENGAKVKMQAIEENKEKRKRLQKEYDDKDKQYDKVLAARTGVFSGGTKPPTQPTLFPTIDLTAYDAVPPEMAQEVQSIMTAMTNMQTVLQQNYALKAPAIAAQQGGSTSAASASMVNTTPTVPPGAASTTTNNHDQQDKGAKDGEQRRRESKSRSRGRDRKSKSPRRKGGERERTTSSTSRALKELNKGNINAKTRSPSKKRQASKEGEDAPPHVARQLPEVDLENVHHAPRNTA
jgi:hypothetical protein